MREQLVDALRAYHRAVIAPHEEHIQERLYAERARHARTLFHAADRGAAGRVGAHDPLAATGPGDPSVPGPPRRPPRRAGLLLIPSHFCWNAPIALADPGLPPVLLYPPPPAA